MAFGGEGGVVIVGENTKLNCEQLVMFILELWFEFWLLLLGINGNDIASRIWALLAFRLDFKNLMSLFCANQLAALRVDQILCVITKSGNRAKVEQKC